MIFKSELFIKDYQLYLGRITHIYYLIHNSQIFFSLFIEKFEELADKENNKKIQKCVKNL